MTKKDLVGLIAEETGLTHMNVSDVLDAFCDIAGTAMQNGDRVRLVGFGTFSTKNRAVRIGRNPRTGEEVSVPASVIPVFKAGKNLKAKVNSR